MPGTNFPPGYDLGQRLQDLTNRTASLETKQAAFTTFTVYANTTNFSIPNAWTALNAATCQVPAGRTTLYVTATSSISAGCQPPSSTYDYLESRVHVTVGSGFIYTASSATYGSSNGSGGTALPVPWVTQYPSVAWLFQGIQAGQTVYVYPEVTSGLGWAANPSNTASINAALWFMA